MCSAGYNLDVEPTAEIRELFRGSLVQAVRTGWQQAHGCTRHWQGNFNGIFEQTLLAKCDGLLWGHEQCVAEAEATCSDYHMPADADFGGVSINAKKVMNFVITIVERIFKIDPRVDVLPLKNLLAKTEANTGMCSPVITWGGCAKACATAAACVPRETCWACPTKDGKFNCDWQVAAPRLLMRRLLRWV